MARRSVVFRGIRKTLCKDPAYRSYADVDHLLHAFDLIGEPLFSGLDLDEGARRALACALVEKIPDAEEDEEAAVAAEVPSDGGAPGEPSTPAERNPSNDAISDEPVDDPDKPHQDDSEQDDMNPAEAAAADEPGAMHSGHTAYEDALVAAAEAAATESAAAEERRLRAFAPFEVKVTQGMVSLTLGVRNMDWERIVESSQGSATLEKPLSPNSAFSSLSGPAAGEVAVRSAVQSLMDFLQGNARLNPFLRSLGGSLGRRDASSSAAADKAVAALRYLSLGALPAASPLRGCFEKGGSGEDRDADFLPLLKCGRIETIHGPRLLVAEGAPAAAAFVLLGGRVVVRKRERLQEVNFEPCDVIVATHDCSARLLEATGQVIGGDLLGATYDQMRRGDATYSRTASVPEGSKALLLVLPAAAVKASVVARHEGAVCRHLRSAAALSSATGLAALEAETIESLATVCKRRELRIHETLVTQGEAATALFILCRGELKLHTRALRTSPRSPQDGSAATVAAVAAAQRAHGRGLLAEPRAAAQAVLGAEVCEVVQRYSVIGKEAAENLPCLESLFSPPPPPHAESPASSPSGSPAGSPGGGFAALVGRPGTPKLSLKKAAALVAIGVAFRAEEARSRSRRAAAVDAPGTSKTVRYYSQTATAMGPCMLLEVPRRRLLDLPAAVQTDIMKCLLKPPLRPTDVVGNRDLAARLNATLTLAKRDGERDKVDAAQLTVLEASMRRAVQHHDTRAKVLPPAPFGQSTSKSLFDPSRPLDLPSLPSAEERTRPRPRLSVGPLQSPAAFLTEAPAATSSTAAVPGLRGTKTPVPRFVLVQVALTAPSVRGNAAALLGEKAKRPLPSCHFRVVGPCGSKAEATAAVSAVIGSVGHTVSDADWLEVGAAPQTSASATPAFEGLPSFETAAFLPPHLRDHFVLFDLERRSGRPALVLSLDAGLLHDARAARPPAPLAAVVGSFGVHGHNDEPGSVSAYRVLCGPVVARFSTRTTSNACVGGDIRALRALFGPIAIFAFVRARAPCERTVKRRAPWGSEQPAITAPLGHWRCPEAELSSGMHDEMSIDGREEEPKVFGKDQPARPALEAPTFGEVFRRHPSGVGVHAASEAETPSSAGIAVPGSTVKLGPAWAFVSEEQRRARDALLELHHSVAKGPSVGVDEAERHIELLERLRVVAQPPRKPSDAGETSARRPGTAARAAAAFQFTIGKNARRKPQPGQGKAALLF